ncbi:hypothetical protein [Leuconostoc lactis]|uniref:hypothetical protein n=1 Tax=Leuconostoc lactis TaxID=1246 RepID=UPI00241D6AAB|nr:hypothetical protein [Leuconostoc lactis]
MARTKIVEKKLSMENKDFDIFVDLMNNKKLDKNKAENREKNLNAAKKAFLKTSAQTFNFVRA